MVHVWPVKDKQKEAQKANEFGSYSYNRIYHCGEGLTVVTVLTDRNLSALRMRTTGVQKPAALEVADVHAMDCQGACDGVIMVIGCY